MSDSHQSNSDDEVTNRIVILLTVAILVFGALLRIWALGERSLWVDEAWVALKIAKESVWPVLFDPANSQAFDPLNNHYSYPPLFGVAIHLFYRLLGRSEWALLLFPMLCSLASLGLMAVLSRKMLGRIGAIASTGIFAFSWLAVIYGKELKQYSTDMMMGLAATLLVEWLIEKQTKERWAVFVFFAATGIWLSQTLLFVLPGLWLVLLVHGLRKRDREMVTGVLISSCLTGLSFIPNYLFFVRKQMSVSLAEFWQDRFVDSSSAGAFFNWAWSGALDLAQYYFMKWWWVAVILALAGIASWWFGKRRYLVYALSPALVGFIASVFGKYLFGGVRTFLFAMPFVILPVAAGALAISQRISKPFRVPAAFAGLVALASWAVPSVNVGLLHPFSLEESKPVIQAMEKELLPTVPIYVYCHGRDTFDWYFRGDRSNVVIGSNPRKHPDRFESELHAFTRGGGLFWFFLTHYRVGGIDDRRIVLKRLMPHCSLEARHDDKDAEAILLRCRELPRQ